MSMQPIEDIDRQLLLVALLAGLINADCRLRKRYHKLIELLQGVDTRLFVERHDA
jgi:hypothetical protein